MNLIATSYACRRFVQFGRKDAKSCAVNGERLSCEKPQAVDQSNSFRQFDESFDPRAAHVSLSSKSLRRRSRREFATQSSPQWRARSSPRPPQRAKFLYGGEVAKRFADLEQILFFFGQTLRSRFAAEKNSVKRNFAKPLLLSLRLHAQRKSVQTLLCNFDLMCFCLQPARRSCGFYLVPFCIKSERPRGSFHLPRGRSVSDSLS